MAADQGLLIKRKYVFNKLGDRRSSASTLVNQVEHGVFESSSSRQVVERGKHDYLARFKLEEDLFIIEQGVQVMRS